MDHIRNLSQCGTLQSLKQFESYHTLTTELIKLYRIVPLKIDNKVLHIATSDPNKQYVLIAITFHTG